MRNCLLGLLVLLAVAGQSPDTANNIMIKFQKAIKDSDWGSALEHCCNEIKSKAAEYDSTETFFKHVLPIDEIVALSEFRISGTRTQNDEVISYKCGIKLKDPNYRHPLEWDLSVHKEDSNWVVEFPTKPLDIWLKHEILKMKVANGELIIEPEKGRVGFEVRLIPLTKKFVVGNPMLFHVEMKNKSDETLGYIHTSFTVNDAMMVKDSNGTTVPYIDTSYHTTMATEFVEPGETVVLAHNYDVRSQYHITKPGKYTFRFRGAYGISPSNHVEIDIEPGQLSALEHVAGQLLPVLPKGWKLTRRVVPANQLAEEQAGEAILVHLIGKRTGKGIDIGIQLAIFLDTEGAQVKLPEYLLELEYWGQSQWGAVYVKSRNAEQVWGDYEEQLHRALDIKNDKG